MQRVGFFPGAGRPPGTLPLSQHQSRQRASAWAVGWGLGWHGEVGGTNVHPCVGRSLFLSPGRSFSNLGQWGDPGANGRGPCSAHKEGQLADKCGLPGSGGSVLGCELHRLCPTPHLPRWFPHGLPGISKHTSCPGAAVGEPTVR